MREFEIKQFDYCQLYATERGMFCCRDCVHVSNCPVYGTQNYERRLLQYCGMFSAKGEKYE